MNIIDQPIKAPIEKGQKIGYISIERDGKKIGTVDILADRDIEKASIYDYFIQIIRDWASASDNK